LSSLAIIEKFFLFRTNASATLIGSATLIEASRAAIQAEALTTPRDMAKAAGFDRPAIAGTEVVKAVAHPTRIGGSKGAGSFPARVFMRQNPAAVEQVSRRGL
jgi:hypothetical protein